MTGSEVSVARRIGRFLFAVPILLGVLGLVAGAPARAAAGEVIVLSATGPVESILAEYLEQGIARAGTDRANAVVIRIDTPGGRLDATERIVSALLDASIPTIVWVAPPGGRAASAGTFITLAGHVALMAPGTNIGAASPIDASGEDIPGTLGQKIKNDAIASIRAIAEARGRNADWAAATVAEAKSSPASEALSQGAIDGLAPDLDAVLAFAHGRQVSVRGATVTIDTAEASIVDLPMNPGQAAFRLLFDPNIAFILFMLGFYGLLLELVHPNLVSGVVGGLALILAFIGFGSLPVNVAGLLLVGLAIVLFILELTVTSHGLLTIAGIVCFVLGASALYTAPGTPTGPPIVVDVRVIVAFSVLTGGFMLAVLGLLTRSRRRSARFGAEARSTVLVDGAAGDVRSALRPVGIVYAAGEEWTARTSDDRPLDTGTRIRVIGQDGLTLIVEPTEAPG